MAVQGTQGRPGTEKCSGLPSAKDSRSVVAFSGQVRSMTNTIAAAATVKSTGNVTIADVASMYIHRKDRKSVWSGKSVSVSVDIGGRRIFKTNKLTDRVAKYQR